MRTGNAAGSGNPTSSMSGVDLLAVLLAGPLRIDFDPIIPATITSSPPKGGVGHSSMPTRI